MSGIPITAEVINIFTAHMTHGQQATINERMSTQARQHLVPDFQAQYHRTAHDRGGDQLLELKTIHPCPTRYPERHAKHSGAPVRVRAGKILGEYQHKARRADMLVYGCGRPATRRGFAACRTAGCSCCDRTGPVRGQLRRHQVNGLVIGAYGEGSKSVHDLIRRLAHYGCGEWMRRLPSASLSGTVGRLAWKLKRLIGMRGLRGHVRVLLSRLEYVGAGAAERARRRRWARMRRDGDFWEDARREWRNSRQADHGGEGHHADGDFSDADG